MMHNNISGVNYRVSQIIERLANTINYTPYDYRSILHESKHVGAAYEPLTVFQVIW